MYVNPWQILLTINRHIEKATGNNLSYWHEDLHLKVSHHDTHKKVVAKVENMKGVNEARWNQRTREVTVIYDANVTSVHNIKHFMA